MSWPQELLHAPSSKNSYAKKKRRREGRASARREGEVHKELQQRGRGEALLEGGGAENENMPWREVEQGEGSGQGEGLVQRGGLEQGAGLKQGAGLGRVGWRLRREFSQGEARSGK